MVFPASIASITGLKPKMKSSVFCSELRDSCSEFLLSKRGFLSKFFGPKLLLSPELYFLLNSPNFLIFKFEFYLCRSYGTQNGIFLLYSTNLLLLQSKI